jgi:hypothetical protein
MVEGFHQTYYQKDLTLQASSVHTTLSKGITLAMSILIMQKIKKKITLYIVELPSAYNPLNQQKKFPSVLGGAAIFRPSGLEEIFSPLGFEKRSECGLSIRFALLLIVLEVWLLCFVLVDCFGLVLVFIWFFCEICSGMAEDLTK